MDKKNFKDKIEDIKKQVNEKLEGIDSESIKEKAEEIFESTKKQASWVSNQAKDSINDINKNNLSSLLKNKKTWAIGAVLLLLLYWLIPGGDSKISTECVMNGSGSGKCDFTNVGTSKDGICGKIIVRNKQDKKTAESGVFCSGSVPQKTTLSVNFEIPKVQQLCGVSAMEQKMVSAMTGGLASANWTEKCEFNFQQK
jgi:hypothetical protein